MMNKKQELMDLLSHSLASSSFKSVDILERYTYDRENLPVCIIKDDSANINIASSEIWEYECELSILIISLSLDYSLADEVLKAIKNLPRDSFVFSVKNISIESRFEDVPYHQLSLSLGVKYYCEEFSI